MPVPAVKDPVPAIVNVPELVIGEEPDIDIPVPATAPTDVTVPPEDGDVLVTVYVGKLPLTLIPVPAVNEPVPDIVYVPLPVIGDVPPIEIPFPATAPTEVTVPPDPVAATVYDG